MPGPLLEETHYYPFGLVMSGISSKAAGGLQNRKKFNDGKELENGEFSDGSGLDLYATEFRSYDPQIGRFHQIDALADDYYEWSPFVFAFNNPISFNDPLGLAAQDSIKAPDGQMVADKGAMQEVVVTATVKKNTTSDNTTVKPVGDPIAHWTPKVEEGRTVSKGDGTISGVVAGVVTTGQMTVTPQQVLLTGGFLLAAGFYLSAVNPPGSVTPFHYSGSPDNTFVQQPPYIFKAEDKTDYMGKPKGNTPGNNQAQNKQVESLAKKHNLSDKEKRQLHDYISKQGYGYKEIEKIIINKEYK